MGYKTCFCSSTTEMLRGVCYKIHVLTVFNTHTQYDKKLKKYQTALLKSAIFLAHVVAIECPKCFSGVLSIYVVRALVEYIIAKT